MPQWRIANINTLVSGVYSAIKSINPQVQFGISPQGNITNDLNMGAELSKPGPAKRDMWITYAPRFM